MLLIIIIHINTYIYIIIHTNAKNIVDNGNPLWEDLIPKLVFQTFPLALILAKVMDKNKIFMFNSSTFIAEARFIPKF